MDEGEMAREVIRHWQAKVYAPRGRRDQTIPFARATAIWTVQTFADRYADPVAALKVAIDRYALGLDDDARPVGVRRFLEDHEALLGLLEDWIEPLGSKRRDDREQGRAALNNVRQENVASQEEVSDLIRRHLD